MTKNYFLLSLFLMISLAGFSQAIGSITGKVVNTKGKPVADANIDIEGTSTGTQSSNNGSFTIKRVAAGNYILRVSFVGYQSREIAVEVKENETTHLPDIILKGQEEQLGAVVLQSNGNANSYTRVKSEYVAKLPLKKIENPQVYNSITAELLKEQIATSFDDALKNAPGISKLWESTGRGNDGAGYFSLRGFPVQPTLVNGLPGVTNGSPNPVNIETIEVIKGPSGTLYGSSLISYGGLINVVTKKPYDYFAGNVTYTIGSFGLNRITADVNTPLDEEGNVAVRVNTAYHTENSFQDAGFRKSFFFAPSLKYKVNDRLSFLVNTEFYEGKSTNPTMLFLDRGAPLKVHNIEELGYDPENSFTSNDLVLENPSFSLQGQMKYELSKAWTSQTVVSRSSAKALGDYSYLYESTSFHQGQDEVEGEITNLNSGVVFSRYMSNQNSTTLTSDVQQNFIGDFKLLGMRNRMVAGLDYFNRQVIDNNSGYVGNGKVYVGNASLKNVNESVFGIYDLQQYITDNDSGILSHEALSALLQNTDRNNRKTTQDVYSAYVSDVLNFTPQLSAMASLRIDQFESENNSQTALSPKFGIVYQPMLDRVAIFANYMDGFSNIEPMQQGNPAEGATTTVSFDPERAKQFEIGTKLSLLNDKVQATFSYYDIQVSNIVMEESGRPFYYVQDGERYSRGYEASLVASPFSGFNLIAGYSHNDSKLTNSDQTDFLNRRPESAGPQDLANLWASYRIGYGVMKGFGLGFGGNYASENMIFNRKVGGVFTLPSYTVLNASLFYEAEKYAVNLKLNNITDEEYFNGWSTVNPQKPLNFVASFSYKF